MYGIFTISICIIIITIIIIVFLWIYYQVIITDEVTKLEKFK